MKAYAHLTLAQLRLFARNRQLLFWSLFFPIFFMIMLGSFFGKGGGMNVSARIVDLDKTEASQSLIAAVNASKAIDAKPAEAVDAALEELKQSDRQLVIVIPSGFGETLEAQRAKADKATTAAKPSRTTNTDGTTTISQAVTIIGVVPAKIEVYYDQTNQAAAQTGLAVIQQIADGISKEIVHYAPVVVTESVGVQSLNLSYIDFLVPGIVAMMIMSNNLNGVAGQIASWRERGILRRMQSTPLNASTFIAAQITARLLLNASQAIIVLLVGSLVFGTQVNGSWWLLVGFVLLGTLTFMSIGFIIASLAKTPESAGPIAGFISFPLMFLGGVFFPIKNMPDWLQSAVQLIPITHLTTAMRQVMNVGAGLGTLWSEAVILGGWMVVAFAVSAYAFKWE